MIICEYVVFLGSKVKFDIFVSVVQGYGVIDEDNCDDNGKIYGKVFKVILDF